MAHVREKDAEGNIASSAFYVVAIASSAGGLKALSHVLSMLPVDFPAAIVIVQHLAPKHSSQMAHILGRRTSLQVSEAREGDRLHSGLVFIAPPDQHLLVNSDQTLSLSRTEHVHFVRPSADRLFQSVASIFTTKAIAVVLTGTGYDGRTGVEAIKKEGGTVIVQDEATSEFFGMPSAAIATGCADYILPLNEISGELLTLVTGVIG
jgi:two-component system, chemotaxis family, protein-glutamate methylesterase/glutaminase